MEFRGKIYDTETEWIVANNLADNTLKNLKHYTSAEYMLEPIITKDDKFALVELEAFRGELKNFGFSLLNKEDIKQQDYV